MKTMHAAAQEASTRAARLMAWGRTAKYVDDVLGMS